MGPRPLHLAMAVGLALQALPARQAPDARKLASQDAAVRKAAALALVEQGAAAVPTVLAVLVDAKRYPYEGPETIQDIIGIGGPVQKNPLEDYDRTRLPTVVERTYMTALAPYDAPIQGPEDLGRVSHPRVVAAWILGELGVGSHAVIEGLVAARDFDELKDQAALSLEKLGDAVVPRLLAALNDESWAGRAVAILTRIGEPSVRRLAPWIGAAKADTGRHVLRTIWRLGRCGTKGVAILVPALSRRLRAAPTTERYYVARALGAIGRPACRAIRSALGAGDRATRLAGLVAVFEAGASCLPAVPRLVDMIRHGATMRERRWAIEALGSFESVGPHAGRVRTALVAARADTESYIRVAATVALGALGKEAKPLLPALRKELVATDTTVRIAAARAFRALGGVATDDEALLEKAAADRHDQVREAAKDALVEVRWAKHARIPERWSDDDAIDGLMKLLFGGRATARVAAARRLSAAGRHAVGPLLRFAHLGPAPAPERTRWRRRAGALVSVRPRRLRPNDLDKLLPDLDRFLPARVRGTRRVAACIEADADLADFDPRVLAVWALQDVELEDAAFEALIALLDDEDRVVAEQAVRTLESHPASLGHVLRTWAASDSFNEWRKRRSLGRILVAGGKRAVRLVTTAYEERDDIGSDVCKLLEELAPQDPRLAVKVLAAELACSDPDHQQAAGWALLACGKAAVPALLRRARDARVTDESGLRARAMALAVLARIGKAAANTYDQVLRILRNRKESPPVRQLALEVLVHQELPAIRRRRVAALLEALCSEGKRPVRVSALLHMPAFATPETTLAAAEAALRDDDPTIRAAAARVLGGLGAVARDSLPLLRKHAKQSSFTMLATEAKAAIVKIEAGK